MVVRIPMDPPKPGPASADELADALGVEPVKPAAPSTSTTGSNPARPATTVQVPKPFSNVFVDTTSPQGLAGASNYLSPTWQQELTPSQASTAMDMWGAGDSDRLNTPQLLQAIAAAAGHNKTPSGVWQDAVDAAKASEESGSPKSVAEILWGMAEKHGLTGGGSADGKGGGPSGSGSSGSGGGGGYSGPSYSYSQLGEADLQDLANQIGMTMVGRGVSDDEFAKILKRVRAVEAKRPQVTSSNGAGVSTTQQGVTNSDRQDVIENILAKNPQYGDYQKATTMMDWFGSALNARLQNA